MKFLAVFVAVIAVAASAAVKPVTSQADEINQIVAAIQSPSTDPATAIALEQMLQDLLGQELSPIAVGPAIVDAVAPTPVTIVDQAPIVPTPVIVVDEAPVDVSPVVITPAEEVASVASSAPLVQIIVNVNQASDAAAPTPVINPSPADVAEIEPTPVIVVDNAPAEEIVPTPVIVAPEPTLPVVVPEPVIIGTPELPQVIPEPVVIGTPELPQVIPEPVVIGTPELPQVIPGPAVILPEILN